MPLSVVNNNDGTVTLTVTGTPGGSATQVYYVPFDGLPTPRTWATLVAGSGNFASTQVLPSGHYQFMLVYTVAGATTIAGGCYQSCSNAATEPLYYRVLNAVATVITALNLEDLPPEKVSRQWIPRHLRSSGVSMPRVFVAPAGSEEDVSELIQTDDIRYPVLVVFMASQDGESSLNLKKALKWREATVRAFRNQRMPGVPESYYTTVTYDVTSDIVALQNGILLQAFVLNVTCRERRGIGA